ncbi:MAG TPA: hypothetical protein VK894_05080, partial [Jiangellales bacterium]|nr:hypothetical protein [Jiangellales bacterium]
RRAARAAWDARLTVAANDARWVEGSLVPDVLRAGTAAEASAVWTAGRPRVLGIDAELYDLASTAPDEERAAYAALIQERLRALSSAVDVDASSGADTDVERLRAARGAIDQARADLRAALDSPVQPGPVT